MFILWPHWPVHLSLLMAPMSKQMHEINKSGTTTFSNDTDESIKM